MTRAGRNKSLRYDDTEEYKYVGLEGFGRGDRGVGLRNSGVRCVMRLFFRARGLFACIQSVARRFHFLVGTVGGDGAWRRAATPSCACPWPWPWPLPCVRSDGPAGRSGTVAGDDRAEPAFEPSFLLAWPSSTLRQRLAKFSEHTVSPTLYTAGETLTNIITLELREGCG